MEKTIYSCQVIEDWVDYNGHLNDAEYARIFSLSVDAFMKEIGITDEFRETNAYSMFTLETHVCYLDEMRSEEHTSELQSRFDIVCRLLLEKKKNHKIIKYTST